MKVLITGARGMVGQNLRQNAVVQSHDLLTPDRAELNLNDYIQTKEYLAKNKPDLIVHCAGKVGGIQANLDEPVAFLIENTDLNRNLILAARETGIFRLLNLGSSCMYPRNFDLPLKEEQILRGELEPTNEPYALAKIFSQRLCAYISIQEPAFQYKTLVPCNLYGRFDKFDTVKSHLIPAAIMKIHEAKVSGNSRIVIWGDGTARREFMYAGDLADCIGRSINDFDSVPALMNVGTGTDYTVNEYYRIIAEVVDYKGTFVHELDRPTGMVRKLVSTDRLASWGWRHRTSLHEGIRQTYEYYLKFGAHPQ